MNENVKCIISKGKLELEKVRPVKKAISLKLNYRFQWLWLCEFLYAVRLMSEKRHNTSGTLLIVYQVFI